MEDLLKKIEESFKSTFEETKVYCEYGQVIIYTKHKGFFMKFAENYPKLFRIKHKSEENFESFINEIKEDFLEKYNEMASNETTSRSNSIKLN